VLDMIFMLELLNQQYLASNFDFEFINETKYQTKILIKHVDLNIIRSLVL